MYQTNYMPEFPVSNEEKSYFNVKTQVIWLCTKIDLGWNQK